MRIPTPGLPSDGFIRILPLLAICLSTSGINADLSTASATLIARYVGTRKPVATNPVTRIGGYTTLDAVLRAKGPLRSERPRSVHQGRQSPRPDLFPPRGFPGGRGDHPWPVRSHRDLGWFKWLVQLPPAPTRKDLHDVPSYELLIRTRQDGWVQVGTPSVHLVSLPIEALDSGSTISASEFPPSSSPAVVPERKEPLNG